MIIRVLIILVFFTEIRADCTSAQAEQFCHWRALCHWTSRGCVVGKKPDEKETSVLNNFGIRVLEFPSENSQGK